MKAVEQIVKCPFCGYVADRASEVHDNGAKPKDGDISMCLGCGKFSIFEAGLAEGLRKPNLIEKYDIAMDEDCFKLWAAWERHQAGRTMH